MDRACSKNKKVSIFQNLAGKPTGNISLGRPTRRWENNITVDVKGISVNTRYWIDSAL